MFAPDFNKEEPEKECVVAAFSCLYAASVNCVSGFVQPEVEKCLARPCTQQWQQTYLSVVVPCTSVDQQSNDVEYRRLDRLHRWGPCFIEQTTCISMQHLSIILHEIPASLGDKSPSALYEMEFHQTEAGLDITMHSSSTFRIKSV